MQVDRKNSNPNITGRLVIKINKIVKYDVQKNLQLEKIICKFEKNIIL